MKQHNNSLTNNRNFLNTAILCITCFLFFSACAKKNTPEPTINPSGDFMEIRIDGIELKSTLKTAMRSMHATDENNSLFLSSETVELDHVKATFSLSEETAPLANRSIADGLHAQALFASSQEMLPNAVYRFFLYSVNNGNLRFVASKDGQAGAPLRFEVIKGVTYQWIAYSYNDLAKINDDFDPQNPLVQTSIYTDLLVARGQETIPKSSPGEYLNHPLNIQFSHALARIKFELSAQDFIANILTKGLQIQLANTNHFKTGKLALLSGKMEDVKTETNLDPIKFTASKSVNQASSLPGGSIQTAYLYTADFENSLEDLSLAIHHIEFNSNFEYEDYNVVYPALKGVKHTFKGEVQFAPGKSYTANVNFENNDGLRIGNLVWARGNLAYVDQTYLNRQRAYFTGRVVNHFTDYWYYNALVPFENPMIELPSSNPGENLLDPCRKLGKGEWRLPTEREYESLGRGVWHHHEGKAPTGVDQADDKKRAYLAFPTDNGIEKLLFYKTGWTSIKDNLTDLKYRDMHDGRYMFKDAYSSKSKYRFIYLYSRDDVRALTHDARRRIAVRCVKPVQIN